MARTRVYSRFPQPITFEFTHYVGEGAAKEVAPVGDEDRITLNGTNEVVNHTLIVKEGAVTLFGYGQHNLQKREYTTEDLERLKTHPLFAKMVKNGDISLGVIDDLSKDFTGVGKLSAAELQDRLASQGGNPDEKVSFVAK